MQCPLKTSHDCGVLLDYCAHKLPAGEAAAFERHAAVCEDCSRAAVDHRRVWTALDTWDAPPVSATFDRSLYTRIEQNERRSWWQYLPIPRPYTFGWKPAVSIAAACVTVIAAIVISVPQRPAATPVQESSRIETLEPEQVERTLEDLEMLKQLSLPSGSQNL